MRVFIIQPKNKKKIKEKKEEKKYIEIYKYNNIAMTSMLMTSVGKYIFTIDKQYLGGLIVIYP